MAHFPKGEFPYLAHSNEKNQNGGLAAILDVKHVSDYRTKHVFKLFNGNSNSIRMKEFSILLSIKLHVVTFALDLTFTLTQPGQTPPESL